MVFPSLTVFLQRGFFHVFEIFSRGYDIIWGEPERAPNTRETGSGVYIYVYIYIYLCVILHSNNSIRMLRHHMVDCLP